MDNHIADFREGISRASTPPNARVTERRPLPDAVLKSAIALYAHAKAWLFERGYPEAEAAATAASSAWELVAWVADYDATRERAKRRANDREGLS